MSFSKIRSFFFFALLTVIMVAYQNCGFLDNRIRGEIRFSSGPQAPLQVGPMDFSQKLVNPVYPGISNWNVWLRNDATAIDELHITNPIPCDGTENGRTYACVHSGEYKKFVIPEINSCTGLTATDSLNAFVWFCNLENGSATFYTWGVNTNLKKGLKDLVGASAWLDNSLSIFSNGTLVGRTTPSQWWTNVVQPLPDNSGLADVALNLNVSGTIYTLSTTRATKGYNLDADGIGIVTLNGARLLQVPGGIQDSCEVSTGELWFLGADGRRTILCAGTQKFLWVEADGQFDNLTVRFGLHLVDISFSRINNMTINGAFDRGLSIIGSRNMHIWNVGVHNIGDWIEDTAPPSPNAGLSPDEFGVLLQNTSFSEVHYLTQSQARFTGIRIENLDSSNMSSVSASRNGNVGLRIDSGSSNNDISDVFAFNNVGHGAAILNLSNNNTLTRLTVANNSSYGLHLNPDVSRNLISFVTAVNNTLDAIALSNSCSFNTIHNVLAINNSGSAVSIGNGTGNKITNVVSARNNNTITLSASTGTFVQGALITDVATCNVSGAGNELNNTCQHGPLLTNPTVLDASVSVVAGVTSDSTNANGATGVQAFPSITDWFNFDSPFRGWGLLGSGFPALGNRGACFAGSCQIWDLRLKSTDTTVFRKSIDGVSTNPMFANGGACPINGNQTFLNTQGTPVAFLASAFEFTAMGGGSNGNGFCESNETCVYAPHFGAYQGEGDAFSQTCTFTNGTVSGITLHAFPTLGF